MVDMREWSRADTARLLRVPRADDDKYSRGVVAVRTGSDAYPGAAVLGVEAAWRAGAGMVRFIGTGRAADAVIARRPETVAAADMGRTRADAWVIGSGTDAAARTAAETEALREILAGPAPVVVDAGALDLARGAGAAVLLTPHTGEFSRLCAQLELTESGDRAADAVAVAEELDCAVLLKGSTTLVAAAGGPVIVVSSAPSWLATAGTGDVLAGVLGALLAGAQNAPVTESAAIAEIAAAGAWLHGYAGCLASGTLDGQNGHPIVALDVAGALPAAIGDLLS